VLLKLIKNLGEVELKKFQLKRLTPERLIFWTANSLTFVFCSKDEQEGEENPHFDAFFPFDEKLNFVSGRLFSD
jgi:hypothetical protein